MWRSDPLVLRAASTWSGGGNCLSRQNALLSPKLVKVPQTSLTEHKDMTGSHLDVQMNNSLDTNANRAELVGKMGSRYLRYRPLCGRSHMKG